MPLVIWILVGVIVGFVAGRLAHHNMQGTSFDIFMGIGGALMGGLLMTFVGMAGATGLSIWCILVSILSAIIWLVGFNAATSTEQTLSS